MTSIGEKTKVTDKKQIAGIALLGAVGMTAQADAAVESQIDQVVVGDTAESTLEEIVLASGLHQQHAHRVDNILFGKEYERSIKENPSYATVEEVVLASGLHQQATALVGARAKEVEGLTRKHKLQPEKIDKVYEKPDVAQLEEILLASGLHQQANVALVEVDPLALEEVVLASGLHQQAKVFVYDDISTPAIEEIVLASGLHQQYEAGAPRTVILDDPDTARYDYTVFSIEHVCW